MTTNFTNNGSMVSNSNIYGHVAGGDSEITTNVGNHSQSSVDECAETFKSLLLKITDNEAQARVLSREIESAKASAKQKDQTSFQGHVTQISELLASFGKGITGISGAIPALKAMAVAAGLTLSI